MLATLLLTAVTTGPRRRPTRSGTAFETDCPVYFVFNGTAANALALSAICRSTDAVVCHAKAHINVDECGAPEFFSGGAKLLTLDTPHAKLTSESVSAIVEAPIDEHASRPRALSLTQSTELGTVYSRGEVQQLCAVAHAHGMKVQMDGARFANAVASLCCAPADISWRAGVDVLCLGGTKNGLPFGEALLFFDHALADEFARRRKQGGQLSSKMRFLAAPWVGVLKDDAWLVARARTPTRWRRDSPRPSAIFPGRGCWRRSRPMVCSSTLPQSAIDVLREKGWRFYVFVGATGVRFMCSWDTTPESVDALVDDLRVALRS